MYWLKFLSSGEEAGEIDWKAIGGTWGSATSKLHTWEQITPTLPQRLLDVCNRIEMQMRRMEEPWLCMSKVL